MNILLDTHVFLWCASQPELIPAPIRAALQDDRHALILSVASVWEIQIKVQSGKMQIDGMIEDLIETHRRALGFTVLPVELRHVLALAALPPIHRDPFDRLIIAQAVADAMTVASVDPVFTQYPVSLLSSEANVGS